MQKCLHWSVGFVRSRLLCFNTSVVRQEREAKKQRERNMYLVFFICSDSRKETSSCRSHEPIINQKPIKPISRQTHIAIP